MLKAAKSSTLVMIFSTVWLVLNVTLNNNRARAQTVNRDREIAAVLCAVGILLKLI